MKCQNRYQISIFDSYLNKPGYSETEMSSWEPQEWSPFARIYNEYSGYPNLP